MALPEASWGSLGRSDLGPVSSASVVVFDVRDSLLRVVAIGDRNDDEVYRRSSRNLLHGPADNASVGYDAACISRVARDRFGANRGGDGVKHSRRILPKCVRSLVVVAKWTLAQATTPPPPDPTPT